MFSRLRTALAIVLFTSTFSPTPIGAQVNPLAATSNPGSKSVVGTTITTQNWRDYQNYMPDGMIALFQGKYFLEDAARRRDAHRTDSHSFAAP